MKQLLERMFLNIINVNLNLLYNSKTVFILFFMGKGTGENNIYISVAMDGKGVSILALYFRFCSPRPGHLTPS